MGRENASGIAGAGALLAAGSLLMPWYSVKVTGALAAQAPAGAALPDLGHQSGWEALGSLHWVILVLALLAGLRGVTAQTPAVPMLAAGALLAIVAWRFLDPPTLSETVGGLPQGADPFSVAFVDSLAESIGLDVSPAFGLFFAAIGAGGALYAHLSSGPVRARL
jgi:hypothetical protein